MGCGASPAVTPCKIIPDQYRSYEEVTAALKKAGLESSQLMVGVDFTESNDWNGSKNFGGRSLHNNSDPSQPSPYLQSLEIIAKALWDMDDDHQIPAYGFGDVRTGPHAVFSFNEGDVPCKGLVACAKRYKELAEATNFWGPTSFAPLIRQAVKLVRETNEYHILVIIADGQVSKDYVQATTDAIVEASNYALSIVLVGVGDGPWDLMDRFDDELPERRFDNFQFVEFAKVFDAYPHERREAAFATHALMEVPDQYGAVKKLGLLRKGRTTPDFVPPPTAWAPPDRVGPMDPSRNLPLGWVAAWDHERSRYFFCNRVTQETTWKKPEAAGTKPTHSLRSRTPSTESGAGSVAASSSFSSAVTRAGAASVTRSPSGRH